MNRLECVHISEKAESNLKPCKIKNVIQFMSSIIKDEFLV